MFRYRHPDLIARPLEEVGGALERAVAAEFRIWRLRRVERHEGWFRLERKRLLRSDLPCRLILVSNGRGHTALEVEAGSARTAEELAVELYGLALRSGALDTSKTPAP